MKKFLALFLCCFLLVGVAAHHCLADADNSLQAIKDKGTLVLGLDASFPPMGFLDDNGEIVGFDIDVAAAVCEYLGVTLVCQPIDWIANEAELNAGNIDCVWNGMTITQARLDSMTISLPYLRNQQVLVVKKDAGLASLADMAGKNLGLQSGSSAEEALTGAADFAASIKDALFYEDNTIALMDLGVGRLDGVLVDSIVADYYITEMQADYVVLDESLADEEYGIGFRKADLALAEAVNNALIALKADGTLEEISTLWFGADVTIIGEE